MESMQQAALAQRAEGAKAVVTAPAAAVEKK
jgi:hypothetical protein